MKLLPLVLGLVLAGSGVSTPGVGAQSSEAALPSPEKFFGFRMGADRKLANWDRLLGYYNTLAKASTKVKLVELGKSSEGRPYIALFISSPANLAKLDHYKGLNARLADPRGLTDAAAKKLGESARASAAAR